MVRATFFVLLLTLGAIPVCLAQTYEAAAQKFEQLKQNASSYTSANARFLPQGERFDIAPVPNFKPNAPPYQCGIKVWFQLPDGRFVNPVKHRWNPEERFNIWIEPAVPVAVSLHQNYPDDRPTSRQVYPDTRYPETFRPFPPAVASKLPVSFRMDPDMRKEIMSMVVVRCDSGTLPFNSLNAGQPSSAGSGPQDSTTSGPGGTLRMAESFARFNEEANQSDTINGENARFDIFGPPGNSPEFSTTPKDVQFFMLGVGNQHQFQLTLFK